MKKSEDPTQLSYYQNYPICGFCMNAWDILYGRMRSLVTMTGWIEKCKWGGCDASIWDYIDERTEWPYGWKINKATGRPKVFEDPKLPVPIPDYDDRVYHMRKPDHGVNFNPQAPWRKVSERLRAESIKRNEIHRKNGVNLEDIEWDNGTDEDEDTDTSSQTTDPLGTVDLDDPDLW